MAYNNFFHKPQKPEATEYEKLQEKYDAKYMATKDGFYSLSQKDVSLYNDIPSPSLKQIDTSKYDQVSKDLEEVAKRFPRPDNFSKKTIGGDKYLTTSYTSGTFHADFKSLAKDMEQVSKEIDGMMKVTLTAFNKSLLSADQALKQFTVKIDSVEEQHDSSDPLGPKHITITGTLVPPIA